MDHDDELLRIGVFSTLSRISVRMLRHYHERGLLAPALVDPFTGRRYYAAGQLAEAQLIVRLRDAGFPVEAIGDVVTAVGDPARVEAAVDAQRARLSSARERVDAQLSALDRLIPALKESTTMDVTLKTLPEMTVASLRKTIPDYSDEGELWTQIMALAGRSGVPFLPDGISGATFHDAEYRESDVDVEVWMQVSEPFAATAPLECQAVPARQIVTATLRGDYSQMPGVMAALGAYVAEHHLATGPMFNIYRVGPAQDADPANWVTEVCLPVVE